MLALKLFKTRKNGATNYREDGGTVSISVPATAFPGAPDAELQISGATLTLSGTRAKKAKAVDPAVAEAKSVLARVRADNAARAEARIEALATMTTDEIAKLTPKAAARRQKSLDAHAARVAKKEAKEAK